MGGEPVYRARGVDAAGERAGLTAACVDSHKQFGLLVSADPHDPAYRDSWQAVAVYDAVTWRTYELGSAKSVRPTLPYGARDGSGNDGRLVRACGSRRHDHLPGRRNGRRKRVGPPSGEVAGGARNRPAPAPSTGPARTQPSGRRPADRTGIRHVPGSTDGASGPSVNVRQRPPVCAAASGRFLGRRRQKTPGFIGFSGHRSGSEPER